MRRANRLRSRSHYRQTLQDGGRETRPEFTLYHRRREDGSVRVGLTIGRRIGGAVVRNRVRRLLREALRPMIPELVGCDVVIAARPQILEAGVAELTTALRGALTRAGLLLT